MSNYYVLITTHYSLLTTYYLPRTYRSSTAAAALLGGAGLQLRSTCTSQAPILSATVAPRVSRVLGRVHARHARRTCRTSTQACALVQVATTRRLPHAHKSTNAPRGRTTASLPWSVWTPRDLSLVAALRAISEMG